MDIMKMISQLAGSMPITVGIFVLTLVFSLPLGLMIAFCRMSKSKIISGIAKFYISIMRGTPLMLQLMVVFFGPALLFGIQSTSRLSFDIFGNMIQLQRWNAVIIGFSLNYAAYFAEIYRGGIESMPIGQYEASRILGFSKMQCFFKIILPQVIKRILPPVTNEVITLVKDTSLAFVLAVPEVFTKAQAVVSRESSLVPFVAAGLFYYIFNLLVAFVMERIEKKLDYYH